MAENRLDEGNKTRKITGPSTHEMTFSSLTAWETFHTTLDQNLVNSPFKVKRQIRRKGTIKSISIISHNMLKKVLSFLTKKQVINVWTRVPMVAWMCNFMPLSRNYEAGQPTDLNKQTTVIQGHKEVTLPKPLENWIPKLHNFTPEFRGNKNISSQHIFVRN